MRRLAGKGVSSILPDGCKNGLETRVIAFFERFDLTAKLFVKG